MKKHIKYFNLFLILTVLILGCEKKSETPDTKETNKIIEETKPVEVPNIDSVKTEVTQPEPEIPVVQIPDLKGKWVGTFDSRSTTLNITEQTDSTFSGKITINYREVINQNVAGTVSPSKMKISMKDQLHSRYRGKYYGSLSNDGKTFSGTFTMDLDKSKFSFNLKRK